MPKILPIRLESMEAPNQNSFRIARPGEASPQDQVDAQATLNAMERQLEQEIAILPIERQGPIRQLLQREMSLGRHAVLTGGVDVKLIAQNSANACRREVEAAVFQAQAGTALRAAVFLDEADTILTEQERRALRNDIASILADQDEIFSQLSAADQRELVESTARYIESDPELAGNARFMQQNPDMVRTARAEIEGERKHFREIRDREDMAPYRDRLGEISGKLGGFMPRGMSALMDKLEAGEISAEEFVTRSEAIVQREMPRIARFRERNLEGLRRENPAVADAFQSYLTDNNLTMETYSGYPKLDPVAVKAAYARRSAAGGDFAQLSREDQQLIARYQFETRQRATNDIRNVIQVITCDRSHELQAELKDLNPQERAAYLIDRGLIPASARDEAEAVFKANTDEELFSRQGGRGRREVYGKTMAALGEYGEASVDRAIERESRPQRDKFDNEIKDLTDAMTAKGWARYRSADGSRTFDLDGDGRLELEEIKAVLKANGVTTLEQMDSNKDGELTRDELVRAMTPIVEKEGAKIR